jgi:hypothetical protein
LVILVLPLSWWSGLGSAFKTQPRASFDQWWQPRGHRCIAEIDVVSCRPARKILLIARNNWNNARSQGAILGCSNTSWHHRPSHTRVGFEDRDDTLFVWAFFHLGLCRNFDPLTHLFYFKIYLKISSQWSLSWCFNKNRIDTLVYDKNDPFNYTEMMRLSRNHPATFLHSHSAQHETIPQSKVGKFNSTKVAWVSIQSTKIIHSMTTRWSTLSRNSFLNLPLLTWALSTPVMLCVPIFSGTLYCTNLEVFTWILMASV